MKKFTFLLLTLLFIFTLFGCAPTQDTTVSESPQYVLSQKGIEKSKISELLVESDIVPLQKIFIKNTGTFLLAFYFPLSETQSEILLLDAAKQDYVTQYSNVQIIVRSLITDTTITEPYLEVHGYEKKPSILDAYSFSFDVTLYTPQRDSLSSVPFAKGKGSFDYNFDLDSDGE